MATTDRFEIIAPLPSFAGFRRALAVDRAGPPRAVVLAFAPARVADDPIRLAALARDAEAAARVRHPGVVPVEGLETVGGGVAVVELHRLGPSLRDLLDAGGRLPPEVAARVVADACAGLSRVHALDPGDGRPLAHGSIGADRLVIGEDGATAVSGLGAGLGEDTAADVRALAAVLHECLVGEPPASPPRPLDAPGVPPALGAVVDLALGATGGQPLRSAGVLGEAIAAALPLAPRETVAAYAEAILPAGEGERAALARLVGRATDEPAADLALELVEEDEPVAVAAAPAQSATGARPEVEVLAAQTPSRETTAAPIAIAEPMSSLPPAVLAPSSETVQPAPARVTLPEPVVIPARAPAPAPSAPAAGAGAPSPDTVSTFPAPAAVAPRRSRAQLWIAVACVLIGVGVGFVAARGMLLPDLRRDDAAAVQQPPPAVGTPGERAAAASAMPSPARDVAPADAVRAEEAEVPPPARPAKKARAEERKAPARRVAAAKISPTGFLVVTAPAEAEVLLDGKRLGRGDVRREIAVGAHRVEVRLGEASVTEQFTISRGETWTYDVTPTSN
ncbi:hypothetical protein [Anaeromyxobacter sp. Fw109-5]|uniref:hypothetical protein n=1 Tax=Anaeromyxobacter sp. (strain Fw109-5) TaxID=404589 RepID=UPI000158A535|nr:hypothetical protein [Anaeromyxobacter sp. Fw109-5]ABS26751.1 conserved hypothetical protein [Anaeromyxobacter sp. Fw109-5]